MKNSAILLVAFSLITLLGGCFWHGTAQAVAEFDLPLQDAGIRRKDMAVRTGLIRNFSGAKNCFLMHDNAGNFWLDESRRWLLPPEAMVERELYRSFLAAEREDFQAPTVDAVIHRFALDPQKDEFSFAILYTIRHKGNKIPLLFEKNQKIENGDIPAAVEKCLTQSMQELGRKLSEKGQK